MTLQQAIEIAKDHQRWRRSQDEYQVPVAMPKYSTKEVGEAIDILIETSMNCIGTIKGYEVSLGCTNKAKEDRGS